VLWGECFDAEADPGDRCEGEEEPSSLTWLRRVLKAGDADSPAWVWCADGSTETAQALLGRSRLGSPKWRLRFGMLSSLMTQEEKKRLTDYADCAG
jgi:hypothetical protein